MAMKVLFIYLFIFVAKFHHLATKKKELQLVHMFFCVENGSKVAILIFLKLPYFDNRFLLACRQKF